MHALLIGLVAGLGECHFPRALPCQRTHFRSVSSLGDHGNFDRSGAWIPEEEMGIGVLEHRYGNVRPYLARQALVWHPLGIVSIETTNLSSLPSPGILADLH
jgi:hypothetical protein